MKCYWMVLISVHIDSPSHGILVEISRLRESHDVTIYVLYNTSDLEHCCV